MKYRFYILVWLLGTSAIAESASPDALLLELEARILSARLQGDYPAAIELTQRLAAEPGQESLALALALDTRLTELSWDMRATSDVTDLINMAETLITTCKPAKKSRSAEALFVCGRGHFARSYLSAMQGNLFKAGSHGSEAIDAFEASLAADPDKIAVKLPLGMAYFYADHLPPFVKLIAPLMWFIPTGNSSKSLPYIRDVINGNGVYADAARFILSDLIMQQSPEHMQEAMQALDFLADRYPMNPRLHLARIAGYAYQEAWPQASSALNAMKKEAPEDPRFMVIGDIWEVYIAKYLEAELTNTLQHDILALTPAELPTWAEDWHTLAAGIVLDYQGKRDLATARYQNVVDQNNDYASGWLQELAEQGLTKPLIKVRSR